MTTKDFIQAEEGAARPQAEHSKRTKAGIPAGMDGYVASSYEDVQPQGGTPLERAERVSALFEEHGLPDREELWNSREPRLGVVVEQAWHRVALWMKVQGASNRAIAQQLNKSNTYVGQLVRQPWARARMAEIANTMGQDEVQAILKGAVADSVYRLIEMRDDEATPAAVVRGCCTDLIHQYLGKPKQQVEHTASSGVSEMADSELMEVIREATTPEGVAEQ